MLSPEKERVIRDLYDSAFQLVYEFTGAGSLGLAWLHSVAGSSRTILEASDRYSAASLEALVGKSGGNPVSPQTAAAMANAAYQRAAVLSEDSAPLLGIGFTATIATDRSKRGDHRCCIAIQGRHGVSSYDLTLKKGKRDRLGEETLAAQLLVHALALALRDASPPPLDLVDPEHLIASRKAIEDPVALLLEGKLRWVTVHPDGRRIPEEAMGGALLSGSFNPLHAGHEAMALAAEKTLRRPVRFELPIVNADKPPLRRSEIERRLQQFHGRHQVVLTRVALFRQKAELFQGCDFVVGADTAARLVDPRYYGTVAERDEALRHIARSGCRFLVAARSKDEQLQTLGTLAVPREFEPLFIELPESAFRVDLSSTAIRERRSERDGDEPQ